MASVAQSASAFGCWDVVVKNGGIEEEIIGEDVMKKVPVAKTTERNSLPEKGSNIERITSEKHQKTIGFEVGRSEICRSSQVESRRIYEQLQSGRNWIGSTLG